MDKTHLTGPEHYRQAERYLEFVSEVDGYDTAESREILAAAQVHATLALAAATALVAVTAKHTDYRDARLWAGIARQGTGGDR